MTGWTGRTERKRALALQLTATSPASAAVSPAASVSRALEAARGFPSASPPPLLLLLSLLASHTLSYPILYERQLLQRPLLPLLCPRSRVAHNDHIQVRFIGFLLPSSLSSRSRSRSSCFCINSALLSKTSKTLASKNGLFTKQGKKEGKGS